ncbi:hypothetical protein HGO53_03130 [Wolbachia endosymbiont of Diaphorina citri]|jgi:hypothetical protein|uniref:hypothetical protein n=1 Tax=Wolbachia endosymbiont of Diaphorina citri TaxID=116598 RepID=UPI00030629CE|nr:hypothetical protein [Wolbachia endosymbiont of Diaphorina citri]QJT94302.1 hypothetical protein HGO48_02420 [Wolbachia endosymbiont of Diaphorina citri]QJT95543.1 hypothetical protein HGO49_02420 [Wolbachia endosymbiont of Diaphorina citri]QJT96904.1 hypothetical protein HGO53_03130 [Wolbachia endosymbiont of Diaphorina citri]QLK11200.1 hypothetical protein FK497_02465 [Wolbachia endosymbiont of Diaphorina citri]
MHGNNGSDKRVFDNTAPGGGRVDLSKINPKKIDDFRDMIRREEERKKNQSSGQGSSK